VNRQAQAAVLFLVGAAVLHAGLTDLYLRYVKAGLRPLLLAAGVVLIMAAVATVWYERRGRAEAGDGSYSAMHAGTALQAPLAYPSLPATDPLPLGVVDYAGRAAYDHGRTLAHRRVEVTGFVALAKDGTPYLVRMALNCCAADAQPVKIGLTGHIPPILQPDTWLQVTGTYTAKQTKDPVNDGRIPFLDVTAAKPVPTPHDPYDESWNN
jgi:hypothetical protein